LLRSARVESEVGKDLMTPGKEKSSEEGSPRALRAERGFQE
jgi:hypothetical protein